MRSRILSLGSSFFVFALLLFAGSASAQDVSPRCEAAMDRAAGDYSRCLLLADAHYARHANATKLENRQAHCETRFDRRTSRAINRHGADKCPGSDLVAAIGFRTASYTVGASTEAAGSEGASVLYVQDATGGTLSETTLVLSGIDAYTGWFAERPYRKSGQITTAQFVALFSQEGANSFAEDPPNADFTCESGGEVVNQVVTLTAPVLDETANTLTYTAALVPTAGDDDSFAEITCDAAAHLFIDDAHQDEANPAGVTLKPEGNGMVCEWAGIDHWGLSREDSLPNQTPFTQGYNCFVAGYCKEAAAAGAEAHAVAVAQNQGLLIDIWDGYIKPWYNRYEHDSPSGGAALAAGCNEGNGKVKWEAGVMAYSNGGGKHADGINMPHSDGTHSFPPLPAYIAYQICQ